MEPHGVLKQKRKKKMKIYGNAIGNRKNKKVDIYQYMTNKAIEGMEYCMYVFDILCGVFAKCIMYNEKT
jgi:hypothetical protein